MEMEKEKIAPWVERMNAEPDGKKRNGIVAEMCKEHSLKIGDAWKLLKENGFGAQAAPNGSGTEDKPPEEKPSEDKPKTVAVRVSHKTEYPRYRCAGLVLTSNPENYLVTEEQFNKLKNDPWVVVKQ
jgi:hypothetical protein